MPTTDELISFIIQQSGTDKVHANSDIFSEVGMIGDDFHDMIEDFAKTYHVDMTGYLWYFHADEEGFGSLGGWFFKPPYERVERIPITPAMLTDFANKGKWDITYPEHKIPAKRHDLTINKMLIVLFLILILLLCLKSCH